MVTPDSTRLALVTGGAGFIGSHVVAELLEEGWGVRVLDDFSSGSPTNLCSVAGRIEVVRGDVRDGEALAKVAAGVEVIFHLAAIASVPGSIEAPVHSHDVNLGGTLKTLEAARSCGVRRVVFASSSAIYGGGRPPLLETGPAAPVSPYGVQKLAAEHYLRLYADLYGIETVALRYFNAYGERQDPRSDYAAVIPLFLSAAASGAPLRVHGDGEQTRDFVHVRDVARANCLAADAAVVSGACFNVASGRATRVTDLVSAVSDAVGREVRVESGPPRAGDVRHSWANVEAARRDLGFESRIELAAGIRRALEHAETVQEVPE